MQKRNVKGFLLFFLTLKIRMVIFYSIQLSITSYVSLSIPFSRIIFFRNFRKKGFRHLFRTWVVLLMCLRKISFKGVHNAWQHTLFIVWLRRFYVHPAGAGSSSQNSRAAPPGRAHCPWSRLKDVGSSFKY